MQNLLKLILKILKIFLFLFHFLLTLCILFIKIVIPCFCLPKITNLQSILFLYLFLNIKIFQNILINKFLFIQKNKILVSYPLRKKKEIFYVLKKAINTCILLNITIFFFSIGYKPFYTFFSVKAWSLVLRDINWRNIKTTERPLKIWKTNNKFFFLEDYKIFPEEYLQMTIFWQTPIKLIEEHLLDFLPDMHEDEVHFVGNREVFLVFLNSLFFCDEYEENLKIGEMDKMEDKFMFRLFNLKKSGVLHHLFFFNWYKKKKLKEEFKTTLFYNSIFDACFDIIAFDAAKGKNYFDHYFYKQVASEVFANEIFLFSRIDSLYNRNMVFLSGYLSQLERDVLEKHFSLKKQQDIIMQNSKIWYYSFSVKYNYLNFLKNFHIYLVTLDAVLDESYVWDTIAKTLGEGGFEDFGTIEWPKQRRLYKLFEEIFFTDFAHVRDLRASAWIKKTARDVKPETSVEFDDRKYKTIFSFDKIDLPQRYDIPLDSFDSQRNFYINAVKDRFLQSLKKEENNTLFFGWTEFLFSNNTWNFFLQSKKMLLKTVFRSPDVRPIIKEMNSIHKGKLQQLTKDAFIFQLISENLLKKSKKRKAKKKKEEVNAWFKWAFFQLFSQTEAEIKKKKQQEVATFVKEGIIQRWLENYKRLPLAVFNIMNTIYLARDQLYSLVKPQHEENWSQMKKKFASFSHILSGKNNFVSQESSYKIINAINRFNYKEQKKRKAARKQILSWTKTEKMRDLVKRGQKKEKIVKNLAKLPKYFEKIDPIDFFYFKRYNSPQYYRKFFRNFIRDNICFKIDPFTNNRFGFLTLFVKENKFDIVADRPLPQNDEIYYFNELTANFLQWYNLNEEKPPFLREGAPTETEHDVYYNLRSDILFSDNTENFLHDFSVWKNVKKPTELLYNIQFLNYIRLFFHSFSYKIFFLMPEKKKNEILVEEEEQIKMPKISLEIQKKQVIERKSLNIINVREQSKIIKQKQQKSLIIKEIENIQKSKTEKIKEWLRQKDFIINKKNKPPLVIKKKVSNKIIKKKKNESFQQKDRFLETISLQINKIFQQLNFVWFENRIDDALEQGKKFETFYPNHWSLTETVDYTHTTFGSKAKYADFFFGTQEDFGLSSAVHWQIVSSLEENIFEIELFFEPSFLNFFKKYLQLFENTFFIFLNRFFILFYFIVGFVFVLFLFVVIQLYIRFFDFLNIIYQTFILFPCIQCKFFLMPFWDLLSNKAAGGLHFFFITWFDFFYRYTDYLNFTAVKLMWNLPLSWDFIIVNTKDYTLLINNWMREIFSLDFWIAENRFQHLTGNEDLNSDVEIFIWKTFDTITETNFYMIQTLFLLSVWLINYNLWYVLIGFFLHLLRKILDLSNKVEINQWKERVEFKKKNNWQFCLHILYVTFRFINISLILFFFSLEIVLLKQFIFLTIRWLNESLNDFENLRAFAKKYRGSTFVDFCKEIFSPFFYSFLYFIDNLWWRITVLYWRFLNEVRLFFYSTKNPIFLIVKKLIALKEHNFVFFSKISFLNRYNFQSFLNNIFEHFNFITVWFNLKVNNDFFIIKIAIYIFDFFFWLIDYFRDAYKQKCLYFETFFESWYSYFVQPTARYERDNTLLKINSAHIPYFDKKRNNTVQNLLKIRYKRLKWFFYKEHYNQFLKKHRICMWRVNIPELYLLQMKTNFFLNKHKNKQQIKRLKNTLFIYYNAKQKQNKQRFAFFYKINPNIFSYNSTNLKERKNFIFLETKFLPVVPVIRKAPQMISKSFVNPYISPIQIQTEFFKNYQKLYSTLRWERFILHFRKRRFFDFRQQWVVSSFFKKQRYFRKWNKIQTLTEEQLESNYELINLGLERFRDWREEKTYRVEQAKGFLKQSYKLFFHRAKPLFKEEEKQNFFLNSYDFLLYKNSRKKTQRIFNKTKKLRIRLPFFYSNEIRFWYWLLFRSNTLLKRDQKQLYESNKKGMDPKRRYFTDYAAATYKEIMHNLRDGNGLKISIFDKTKQTHKAIFELPLDEYNSQIIAKKSLETNKNKQMHKIKYYFLQRDWIKKQIKPLKEKYLVDISYIFKPAKRVVIKQVNSENFYRLKIKRVDIFFPKEKKRFFRLKTFLFRSPETINLEKDFTKFKYYLKYKNKGFTAGSSFKKNYMVPFTHGAIKYFKYTRKQHISLLTIKKQNFEMKYFDVF